METEVIKIKKTSKDAEEQGSPQTQITGLRTFKVVGSIGMGAISLQALRRGHIDLGPTYVLEDVEALKGEPDQLTI